MPRSSTLSAAARSRPPRWLSPVSEAERRRGDGRHAINFLESMCRITEDSLGGASGELLALRDWQRRLLMNMLARRADGRWKHRRGLVGMARKNTKSTLGAGLGLYLLLSDYPDGPQGRQVYSCAGDKEQARIIFAKAKLMVEMEPELQAIITPYKDALEVQATHSVYRALSAEAYTKHGLNPYATLFDEVHVQPGRDLWDAMSTAMGARRESLLLGFTTCGTRYDANGRDSLAYQLYQHGVKVASGEVVDPAFFMCWWEPAEGLDHLDPATWAWGNPGLGDLVSTEELEEDSRSTPETEFRTYRCNQWMMTSAAWLPGGAWESTEARHGVLDGSDVVLAFDGSFNNDSTGIVACSVAGTPHLETIEAWERSIGTPPSWRVPIAEVEDVLRAVCGHLPERTDLPELYMAKLRALKARRLNVKELACDPARWARTFEALQAEGLPVLEFPQSPGRMTPATQRFFESVVNRTLTHSPDQRLARHVGNAILRVDSRGSRITKESKESSRKIDLAVCAVMAHDRACWHRANEGGGDQPFFYAVR